MAYKEKGTITLILMRLNKLAITMRVKLHLKVFKCFSLILKNKFKQFAESNQIKFKIRIDNIQEQDALGLIQEDVEDKLLALDIKLQIQHK